MTSVLLDFVQQLMPGTFCPEEYYDLELGPFAIATSREHEHSPLEEPTVEALRVMDNPSELVNNNETTAISPLLSEAHDSREYQLQSAERTTTNSGSKHAQQYDDGARGEIWDLAVNAEVLQPEESVDDTLDWRQFSPPPLLGEAPNMTSEILLDIVSTSIANVKSRAVESLQQDNEEREQRAREEKAAEKTRKSEALYLPIIIHEQDEPGNASVSSEAVASADLINSNTGGTEESTDALLSGNAIAKEARRRKYGFRRIFQRTSERGESSTANSSLGNTREHLRQKLRTKLQSLDMDPSDLLAQQAMAIFGGIGTSSLLSNKESGTPVECVSCLDEFPMNSMIRVPCHHYCADCFVLLISAAVEHEQQWPPKCCLNPIPFRTILRAVPSQLKKKFQERSLEWNIPVSERVYCHNTDCLVWIQPDYISPGIRQGRCERGHWTCTVCRGPIHDNNECPEDQDMRLTNALAEEEGWKRCSRCNALVEHKEACQHMTCRCGYQFCYVCNEVWRTCSCTVQQLNDLKEAAATRRQRREFQEQEESEELRRILLQIEEFEREEALRLELERQEEERLEEERRQRELEERALEESIRRRNVQAKYRHLRKSLDDLHELQRTMLETYQRANFEHLSNEAEQAKEQLKSEQTLDSAQTDERIRESLSAKETALEEEFAMRVAEEQKIEEDYHRQLAEYWGDSEDAHDEIEAAMLLLCQRMDCGYRAWQQWRREEIAQHQEKLEGQRTIREELMYSARQRLDDRFVQRRLHLESQVEAEGRWFQEIILERERLLNESEEHEMENNADRLFFPDSTTADAEAAAAEWYQGRM